MKSPEGFDGNGCTCGRDSGSQNNSTWAYYTVVCDAPEIFSPPADGSTGEETSGWGWFTAHEITELPLHPGFAKTWNEVRQSRRGKTITKAADGLGGVPVKAKWVYRQMETKFPDDAISWVKDATWVRADVPLDRIDFHHMHEWAAAHEKRKVERFAGEMESGEDDVDPAVMVAEPGRSDTVVVDGHHRVLAARKLGRPVEAYVGYVHSDNGPWLVTHSFQKSERTPIVSTQHNPLGHESLWHTPDRHVATMQQLPAYVQNTARAIAREHGGTPEDAIPEAVAAVKAWAAGHAFGGKVKVTAEVQAAAQAALSEWDRLKASHH